ncbi:SpoIIE family protein phosphatase [Nocardioides caldifontis]|uniref:SpoIIE family protein phosphatase n=1 Tax=Nocardioides caldifontis TaxID=2588938 RepID=UPI001396C004|nr:SpoIIE family protein phosphatase [Nocardioides caldifontis]
MTSGPEDGRLVAELADREDPQTVVDRVPCGLLSTTPDGMVAKVNQTFLDWTGYTREELVGVRRLTSLLTGGGRIFHDTHYAPMLRLQGQVRELALDIVTSDGGRLPVLLNAALERDETGEPAVVRVVVVDATERREYERELLRAKRRAEESELRATALAHTLQRTLMPPVPPAIPGLELHAVYRPAGTGAEVGGDFYDVFEIGEDDWVVTLGDVCGKGVDAAVVTALVRHTLRALSVRTASPAQVLYTLDEVLQHHPTDKFCTVALLRLRRSAEGWRTSVSLGGHPHPMLVSADGLVEDVGTPGSLVGAFANPSFADSGFPLPPGCALVLFTDGVTEARRGDEMYGEQRLRDVVAKHPVGELAQAVLEDVLAFQGGSPRDDIAVVTVAAPPAAS